MNKVSNSTSSSCCLFRGIGYVVGGLAGLVSKIGRAALGCLCTRTESETGFVVPEQHNLYPIQRAAKPFVVVAKKNAVHPQPVVLQSQPHLQLPPRVTAQSIPPQKQVVEAETLESLQQEETTAAAPLDIGEEVFRLFLLKEERKQCNAR